MPQERGMWLSLSLCFSFLHFWKRCVISWSVSRSRQRNCVLKWTRLRKGLWKWYISIGSGSLLWEQLQINTIPCRISLRSIFFFLDTRSLTVLLTPYLQGRWKISSPRKQTLCAKKRLLLVKFTSPAKETLFIQGFTQNTFSFPFFGTLSMMMDAAYLLIIV